MTVRVQLPDLEHWKAQVKCQAGCPVRPTRAATSSSSPRGARRRRTSSPARPNPFASVCGRVCAAPCEDACRRGAIDAPIAIRALKRYVTERYGVESVRPDTQDRLRDELVGEGNRYAGHLPVAGAVSASGQPRDARWRWSAPGPRGSRRRTTWRCSATTSPSSRPPRSPAA